MNFEDAGRAIDSQVAKLADYIDKTVKPATKKDFAELLKKASKKLAKMADGLEKNSR